EMSMSGKRFLTASLAVLAIAALGTSAFAAATITGTVTYDGKVPTLKPLDMTADAACAKKHSTPQPSDVLVLGPGNTMANIMVSVVKGLPAGKTYPAPKEPVVMDQNGCHYDPHVFGLMVGQPLKVLNSDGILHNVHALPKVNKQFNMAMPPTVKESTQSFGQAEGMFMIKCDVHPWMSAYAGVFTHPFYSVSKKDGKFTISGLDPGTYEIEAWHEKLGVQKATVTVAANETKTVAIKFTAPGAAH
ncbi:MAG TPA: carboxypeptidase regulatory-like domain-containing protein, partial [Candidatus Polarisedimenticolaceae bacterium]|nr:carboxypeptidase regulatory-like domain-containing protein [Candidatus Polarisedimenticolaceae bacterium]